MMQGPRGVLFLMCEVPLYSLSGVFSFKVACFVVSTRACLARDKMLQGYLDYRGTSLIRTPSPKQKHCRAIGIGLL